MCKLDLKAIKPTKDLLERDLRDYFNNIDVQNWVKLPIDLKYPAPDHIKKLKIKSGLSWLDFEKNY